MKIVGKRFYQLESVDVAVPVRLTGMSSHGDQTGMMVLHGVERMTLAEIASETRSRTRAERAGDLTTSGSAFGRRLARALPSVVETALDAASAVLQHPLGYRLLGPWSSLSTGITNVGAVFTLPEGARFRSVALTMPARLGHVASAFALAPATEAAVAEQGRSIVRRVLPITMLVDHRVIDGYLMAKLGERLATALLAPETLVSARRSPRAST
jgi:pyruvate/2-oxoglutarate dehydrogenase complex dihydrolipoamide acyltransferase (E2) component